MVSEAGLIVIWSARAITSLVGLLIVVTSHWYYSRKWDEEGSAAYAKVLEETTGGEYAAVDYNGMPSKKFVTNSDGSRDAISVSTADNREAPVPVPVEELKNALPIPYGTAVGLVTWTVSFLFQPGRIVKLYAGWNLCFLLFLPIITILLTFHIRKTTIERNLEYKKFCLSIVLVFSILLMIAGIMDKQTNAPWYFCFFGAVLLFLSYHILRRSRKMGITWEMEGTPNFEVVQQNFGAMTFVFSLYLIWVGTNAVTNDNYLDLCVPIFLGYRSWFIFVAAFVMIIPALMALDFAFERGSAPIPLSFMGASKLDGSTFRRIGESSSYISAQAICNLLESPWFLLLGWFFFGFCSFMPFGTGFTFQRFMTFLISFSIGIVYTLRLLPSYWNKDSSSYQKWSYMYYTLMVFLFTAIGVDGQGALVAAMAGAILVVLGQHIEMVERKKGRAWLFYGGGDEESHENTCEHVVAYSYGSPIYVAGWLLLCLGMAIPMD